MRSLPVASITWWLLQKRPLNRTNLQAVSYLNALSNNNRKPVIRFSLLGKPTLIKIQTTSISHLRADIRCSTIAEHTPKVEILPSCPHTQNVSKKCQKMCQFTYSQGTRRPCQDKRLSIFSPSTKPNRVNLGLTKPGSENCTHICGISDLNRHPSPSEMAPI